jgi:hypothetical protein
MSQKRTIVSVLLMLSFLMYGCVPTPTPTPENTATLETVAQNIVDLVEHGTVTFKITSGAINELGLEVQNTTDRTLKIDIPSGTYFVNADSKSQNMVVRHTTNASVQPKGRVDIQLEAACANLHLTEPTQENTFTIQRLPKPPELTKIIDQISSAGVNYPVEQAAIWIVTDDATYDELGMLVEGSRFGTSMIRENDAVRAMMLVEKAGLSIRGHAISRDLIQFMGKVTESDLSVWLSSQFATQSVLNVTQAARSMTEIARSTTEITQSSTEIVQEATQTPQASSSSNGGEVSQYAKTAVASSQYTSPGWAAMQAVGARDTFSCGDNPNAWASAASTGKDWLLLTYDQAVIPSKIVIFETDNPGAVSLVEVLDEGGNATTVYSAAPTVTSQCPVKLEIEVKDVNVPVRSVRVSIDQSHHNGWNEIDAVQLIGRSK